jgi:hypothetical protein
MNNKIQVMSGQRDRAELLTWDNDADRKTIMSQVADQFDRYLDDADGNQKRVLESNLRFKNILPNVSIRDAFTSEDRDWFRPNEATPTYIKGMVSACMAAYDKNPIVHEVIDMMSELGSQGIRLVHKTKRHEKIFKYWFKKVNGKERSERFLNLFYKAGQVPFYRTTAKLKPTDVKKMYTQKANADLQGIPQGESLEKREIPWIYTFLNPLVIEPIGEDLELSIGRIRYGIRISGSIKKALLNPKTAQEIHIKQSLPPFSADNINEKKNMIELPPDKFGIHFYKKDDWQIFAYPMTAPIIDSIIQYNKMVMADASALDGAISKVRVWKLGSLEHKIAPTAGLLSAFNDLLMNQVPGGVTDIVWNDAISLVETESDGHQFLGSEKYQECKSMIFSGLGVPPSLAGKSGGGLTNNFISTKTLLERLKYGRDALTRFWEKEIELFSKAMGIPTPAQIVFDYMSLSDESAEKALWIQLVDRNIISVETLQERFGLLPDIEASRAKREYRGQVDGRFAPKAGAYPDANPQLTLTKIALQNGQITPSEAGLELNERAPGEVSLLDLQKVRSEDLNKPVGRSGQGRPVNSKDSSKRPPKNVKPQTSKAFIDAMYEGREKYNKIAPILFSAYEKMGTLGSQEGKINCEKMIFASLMNIDSQEITSESLKCILLKDTSIADTIFDQCLLSNYTEEFKDSSNLQGLIYSIIKTGEE